MFITSSFKMHAVHISILNVVMASKHICSISELYPIANCKENPKDLTPKQFSNVTNDRFQDLRENDTGITLKEPISINQTRVIGIKIDDRNPGAIITGRVDVPGGWPYAGTSPNDQHQVDWLRFDPLVNEVNGVGGEWLSEPDHARSEQAVALGTFGQVVSSTAHNPSTFPGC